MTNDELLSKTISWLRFPLIVGVVFIHNNISTITIQGREFVFDNPDWYYAVINFFSEVLPRIAVPLFFFISGFLFFYNVEAFDAQTYRRKLKSRVRTLLIPYLIWNFAGFLLFSIKHIPALSHVFPNVYVYPYNLKAFLDSFWTISIDPNGALLYPINFPFWFIRDLMIVVLFTPLLYWFVRHLRFVPVLLLGICWFFGLWFHVAGLSSTTWFFFTFGAYLSISRLNPVSILGKFQWLPIVYIVIALLDTATKGASYNGYVHKMGILLGVASCFILTARGIGSGRLAVNKFLSDGSFFVFASHGLIIGLIMKGLFVVICPQSPYVLILLYFLVPIVTILLCLIVYRLLKRYLPRVAAVVTGGR